MGLVNLTQVKEAIYSVKTKMLLSRTKVAIHGKNKWISFSESMQITPNVEILFRTALVPKRNLKTFDETSKTLLKTNYQKTKG